MIARRLHCVCGLSTVAAHSGRASTPRRRSTFVERGHCVAHRDGASACLLAAAARQPELRRRHPALLERGVSACASRATARYRRDTRDPTFGCVPRCSSKGSGLDVDDGNRPGRARSAIKQTCARKCCSRLHYLQFYRRRCWLWSRRAIRRIASGTAGSAPRPNSLPGKRNMMQLRGMDTLFRAQVPLVGLRAGHGRSPSSKAYRVLPPRHPNPSAGRREARQLHAAACGRHDDEGKLRQHFGRLPRCISLPSTCSLEQCRRPSSCLC